jgi:hypothetical protein
MSTNKPLKAEKWETFERSGLSRSSSSSKFLGRTSYLSGPPQILALIKSLKLPLPVCCLVPIILRS